MLGNPIALGLGKGAVEIISSGGEGGEIGAR
jgi:hypothetical protein